MCFAQAGQETVGVIAHVVEAAGIPMVVVGTAHDIMRRVRPPRAAFVDHPVGRTFVPPHDRERNLFVVKRALAELPACAWQTGPSLAGAAKSGMSAAGGRPTAAAPGKRSFAPRGFMTVDSEGFS